MGPKVTCATTRETGSAAVDNAQSGVTNQLHAPPPEQANITEDATRRAARGVGLSAKGFNCGRSRDVAAAQRHPPQGRPQDPLTVPALPINCGCVGGKLRTAPRSGAQRCVADEARVRRGRARNSAEGWGVRAALPISRGASRASSQRHQGVRRGVASRISCGRVGATQNGAEGGMRCGVADQARVRRGRGWNGIEGVRRCGAAGWLPGTFSSTQAHTAKLATTRMFGFIQSPSSGRACAGR